MMLLHRPLHIRVLLEFLHRLDADAFRPEPGQDFELQPLSFDGGVFSGQRLRFVNRSGAKDEDSAQITVVQHRPGGEELARLRHLVNVGHVAFLNLLSFWRALGRPFRPAR
jgi:hypothetical protein